MCFKNVGTSFFRLSQSTRLTDRQADSRQTDDKKCRGNTVHCITCSRMVKIIGLPWVPLLLGAVNLDLLSLALETFRANLTCWEH